MDLKHEPVRAPGAAQRAISRRALLGKGAAFAAATPLMAGLLSACGSSESGGATGGGSGAGAGVTTLPTAPFDLGVAAGAKPDLPKRIAWANESDAQFFLDVTNGMKAAAEDRDLEFVTAIAGDNPDTSVQQLRSFLSRGIGGLAVQTFAQEAQKPLMDEALSKGMPVMALIGNPSSCQVAARQFDLGKVQGDAAVKWIKANLRGAPRIAYFNLDKVSETLIPRHRGMLAALEEGGLKDALVVDVYPGGVTRDAGFRTMNTVLQQHPDVNVVMGGDTACLGALAALESAKKDLSDFYISGIDGDPAAMDAVKKGGAYKATFAIAYPVMGYAWGTYMADWLEGKSIPNLMLGRMQEIGSPEAVDAYAAAMADPGKTFAAGVDRYFELLGNISYDTRDRYLAVTA